MTFNRKKIVLLFIVAIAALWYVFALPSKLFDVPYSTVLYDKENNLLNASISKDGQWRFPIREKIPEKFRDAIVMFEDKRFDSHPGVDLRALYRATVQNIQAGKVISGGSTLSMQVVRLSKNNPRRTFFNKIVEIILATRLEWRYSKNEILSMYASHAPFGGNVVGIEAACWRYFGRQPDELSWAEAATLAVLPNNPSMINLGTNRAALQTKRDRLLTRLRDAGKIDSLGYDLAISEPVPDKPVALPRLAPHLMDRAILSGKGGEKITTTINSSIQQRTIDILNNHHQRLKGNQVFNAAALVMEVRTGNVIAYVGNVNAGGEHHESVDVIRARRSTGSILKPFLFAAMINEGLMLPKDLVPDVPTIINGFSPKNFSRQYDGAVPADQALIRSLNIPAVHELREYRYEKFYRLLKDVGLTTLDQPADHYGLSLILGGAEATLWDVTGAYASMARTLTGYFDQAGTNRYRQSDYHAPLFIQDSTTITNHNFEEHSVLDAASIWLTFETLKEVYRPGEETGWRNFYSSRRIAWKTGTSFGFRDGWAVGVTPEFAIGVWVGNADGEGRPGLTGTETAAPILFDIFSQLPQNTWFGKPNSELTKIAVCRVSGARASESCTAIDTLELAKPGLKTAACTNHKRIHLSADRRFRIHAGCEPLDKIHSESWFVLPPVQEYYYRSHHITYRSLPPLRKDCADPAELIAMDMIYPKTDSRIFIPRDLDGSLGSTVFHAAHRDPQATIYWHLDGTFIGATSRQHRLTISPPEGSHHMTLVDEQGETLEKDFKVISK
ncbi:MAG TPA: penicillin-binding protein 1C [Cyclobacteriaceae bacterium]|nr:penicillin-binding protein 1C [Cyclobacteriaceae bacterium]